MRKILLIDDDVSIIELVTEFLSQYKYKIVSSTSGRQTTALALSEEPDLIILDINLPDVDGLTILNNLKKTTNYHLHSGDHADRTKLYRIPSQRVINRSR